jgi:hypothetical protein
MNSARILLFLNVFLQETLTFSIYNKEIKG